MLTCKTFSYTSVILERLKIEPTGAPFFFPTSIPYTIIYKSHSPDIKTSQVKTRNSISSTVQLPLRQFPSLNIPTSLYKFSD